MKHRAAPAGAAVLAVLICACGQAPRAAIGTAGVPRTAVCGAVLSESAAAPVVYDATGHLPTITEPTIGDVLMFRVASGCDKGAHVSWAPASAARLVKAAYAKDGGMAAVVLRPSGPKAAFRLTGTQDGRVVASATVRLTEP